MFLEQLALNIKTAELYEANNNYEESLNELNKVDPKHHSIRIPEYGYTVASMIERLNQKIKLRETRREKILVGQAEAVRLLKSFEYDKALKVAVVLQPDRKDMIRLLEQLQERENKSHSHQHKVLLKATNLFEQQEYDSCIQNLNLIEAGELNSEVIKLKDEAQNKLDQYHARMEIIREDLKQKRFHGLLKKVDECLELKRNDTKLQDLRDKLIARESSILEIYETAFALYANSQFDSALEMILKIPKGFQSDSVKELENKCLVAIKTSHSKSKSVFSESTRSPVNEAFCCWVT